MTRTLDVLRDEVKSCTKCSLHATRTNTVFSRGSATAALCIVGEAPGEEEDVQGLPFVGRSGKLLDEVLTEAGLDVSKDIYICNIIKCRPPNNRNPEPDEISACEQFLRKQIAIVQPRVIVALGKFAAHFLCGETTPITRLRGNLRTFHEIPVMPTYHPAFLLRDESRKGEAWADLKQVMGMLKNMGLR